MKEHINIHKHYFVADEISKHYSDFYDFENVMKKYYDLFVYGVSLEDVKQALIDNYGGSLQMYEAYGNQSTRQLFVMKFVEFSIHSTNHFYVIQIGDRRGWQDKI